MTTFDEQKEQRLDFDCCLWCRINHLGKNPCIIRELHKALFPYVDTDPTIKHLYSSLFDFEQELPCTLFRFSKEALQVDEKELNKPK